MGFRGMFVAGFAVGYVVGTRAGREKYDQMVKYGKQVAGSPAFQQATTTVKTKTTEVTKTAVAKAPDIAKSAGKQGSKMVSSAKQAAAEHMPAKLGGKNGGTAGDAGDVAADGSLVYPAEEGRAPVNGSRYTS